MLSCCNAYLPQLKQRDSAGLALFDTDITEYSAEGAATHLRMIMSALENLNQFIQNYRRGCGAIQIDYVQMDTATPFDYALSAYLFRRK